MTNLEKAKKLREIRKGLGWTQPAMASELGLDVSYLSQLENGKRRLDDWYLGKALEIQERFEKSKEVKGGEMHEQAGNGGHARVRARAHAYLDRVLDACGGDSDRLTWTVVELERHFPTEHEHIAYRPFSSISPSEAALSGRAAERALELEQRRGSSTSGGAGEPSGHKHGTSPGTSEETKGKKSPPGPAQG